MLSIFLSPCAQYIVSRNLASSPGFHNMKKMYDKSYSTVEKCKTIKRNIKCSKSKTRNNDKSKTELIQLASLDPSKGGCVIVYFLFGYFKKEKKLFCEMLDAFDSSWLQQVFR